MAITGAPLNFAGSPYGFAQTQATAAYERALANIQQQRSQFQTQEGFSPTTGKVQYNPVSNWGQLSNSIQQGDNAARQSIFNRGLMVGGQGQATGLAGQIQAQANYARDTGLNKFSTQYQQGLQKFDSSKLAAEQNYESQLVNNRLRLVQYLISKGQYPHAPGAVKKK